MKTWTGNFLGWLSLAAVFSFGVMAPRTACAAPLAITSHPASQNVIAGSNATFAVSTTGGQGAVSYQWKFNGTNLTNNVRIAGATNASLTITGIMAADAGIYRVTVADNQRTLNSSNATLTVLFPPTITNQPTNQAVILTSNATFTVTAGGTGPLSYQWQRGGTNLSTGGNISGATSATLSLTGVWTNDAGSYQVVVTNSYGVAASAVASLTVLLPVVTISDASVIEGDSGSNAMIFTLQLSQPIGAAASVGYWTDSGSAADGEDFDGSAGTVLFAPGQTNQSITVLVRGDGKYEMDEQFPLYLAQPVNMEIVNYVGMGTILNDDPLPEISAQSTSWPEGNIRSTNRLFRLILSRPSQLPMSVAYQTAEISAVAGTDFITTNGLVTFSGTTNADVAVLVKGDLDVETNEVFAIELSDPTNGNIAVAQGIGTILNDDGMAGFVHHFGITAPSGASARIPAVVTVTALDVLNQPITNFTGSVLLMAGFSNLPPIHLDFEEGDFSVWSPLNSGNQPGPYEILPFDIAEPGLASLSVRIAPNPGLDGVATSLSISKAGRYFLSVLMAQAMGSPGNGDGATARIAVDGVQIITNAFGLVYYSTPLRSQLYVACDIATTNLPHTFSLLFDRIWYPVNPYRGLGIYSDDFVVSPAPMPGIRSTAFTNGVWTGPVIFRDAVTNVVLFADDDERHRGSSVPFNVQQSLDVAVGIGYTPAVPRVGTFSLNLIVTNLGSRAASAVVVTNGLPAGLTFVSASTANGSCINSGTNLLWLVGTLASGQVASATAVVRATDTNTFSPSAIASVAEPDFNLANNSATTTFTPAVPSLGTVNMSASEQVGGSVMTFPVTLSAPFDHEVSVEFYSFWNPNAGNFDGDIIPTNGVLVFPPGVTQQQVDIAIVDDLRYEGTEFFSFVLDHAQNAVVGAGIYSGLMYTATLYDNDPPPTLAISDCAVVEGDAGTTNAVFTVTLVGATALNTTVNFATASGTALAGSDFIATNGSLTFPPGTNSLQIVIRVKGNTVNESDETFFVNLSSPGNATVADAQGVGTLLNDDAVPNRLDHFEWFWEIPSPQIKNRFIPAALVARDAFGQVIYDFQGTVTLSAMASNGSTNLGITPITISNFQNGAWADYLLFTNTGNQVVLRADDGNEHVGLSNPFDLLTQFPLTLQLPAVVTEGDGVLTDQGRVWFPQPELSGDVWVTLSSAASNDFQVPVGVWISAGQTSTVFTVTVNDNAWLNGTRTINVSATATNYTGTTANVVMHDNDFGILSLTLPASGLEKSSPLPGTLTLSAPPSNNVVVTLTSSDTTELTVPATVTIPVGQTSVGFNANAVDDTLLDGTQFATVTAHVQNWQDGMATVAVIDNETNKFTVNYWFQGPFTEGMGTISNALRLTVGGVLISNLTVNLTSSDTTELTVPATVTIGTGSNNVLFNITIVDDTETDSTQPVTVSASLPTFTSGSLAFNIQDNDLHHFTFSTFNAVQTSGVPFNVTVTAKDASNLPLTGYTNTPAFTALGSGGALSLMQTGFTANGIVRGSFSGSVTVTAPVQQAVILRATDGFGHEGFSSSFQLRYPVWAGTPQIGQVQMIGSDVVLSFSTVPTAQYFLQTATNLPPVWISSGPGVIGTGSIMTFTNPAVETARTRFFRLLVQPTP